MSDTARVRQTYRGEQVPDLYYQSDAPDADSEEADPADAEEDFKRYQAECRAVHAALEGAAGRHIHVPGAGPPAATWNRARRPPGDRV